MFDGSHGTCLTYYHFTLTRHSRPSTPKTLMTAGPRRSSLNGEKSVSTDDDNSRRRSGSLREVEDSSMQDVARGPTQSLRTSKKEKGSVSVSRSVTKKDKATSSLREGSYQMRGA